MGVYTTQHRARALRAPLVKSAVAQAIFNQKDITHLNKITCTTALNNINYASIAYTNLRFYMVIKELEKVQD